MDITFYSTPQQILPDTGLLWTQGQAGENMKWQSPASWKLELIRQLVKRSSQTQGSEEKETGPNKNAKSFLSGNSINAEAREIF